MEEKKNKDRVEDVCFCSKYRMESHVFERYRVCACVYRL